MKCLKSSEQVAKFLGVPVVKGESLVGIITNRDLRFETNLDQQVASVMTNAQSGSQEDGDYPWK